MFEAMRVRPKTGWQILPVTICGGLGALGLWYASSELAEAAAAGEAPSVPDRLLELGAVALIMFGGFLALCAFSARLSITQNGELVVRSLPPWRRRRVLLADLDQVQQREHFPLSVTLIDVAGGRVHILVEGWHDEQTLLELLRRWIGPSRGVSPRPLG